MVINGANPSSARNFSVNNQAAASSLNKLSSGSRINSAGDDAAGLAISENMRGQIGGISKALQNAQAGVSLAQTAEGGLSTSADILTRMRELATQASNGTYSREDRALLNREFEQLKGSLDQISESTRYNNTNLLDGSLAEGGMKFQVGANGTGDDRIDISIGDMSSEALDLSEINLEDPDGALEAIDGAINTVSRTRGDIAAVQDRLESSITNLAVAEYNITASESNIRDLDMAKEVLNRTQRQILAEAGQAAQVHQMNLMRQNAAHLLK